MSLTRRIPSSMPVAVIAIAFSLFVSAIALALFPEAASITNQQADGLVRTPELMLAYILPPDVARHIMVRLLSAGYCLSVLYAVRVRIANIWLAMGLSALIVTNPVVLSLLSDSSSSGFLIGITWLWHATSRLRQSRFTPAGIETGLALGALFLLSAYSVVFLPAILACLIMVIPRRLLRKDTSAFLIIISFPLVLGTFSLFYMAMFFDNSWVSAITAPHVYFNETQASAAGLAWHARYGDHLFAGTGAVLVWSLLLAPASLIMLWARRPGDRRWALFTLFITAITSAMLSQFSLFLPPLILLGAIFMAGALAAGAIRSGYALACLLMTWAGGLLAVLLYTG